MFGRKNGNLAEFLTWIIESIASGNIKKKGIFKQNIEACLRWKGPENLAKMVGGILIKRNHHLHVPKLW